MDATTISPDAAVIGIIAAALLAGLKALAPSIQKQVPNFLWPLAVLVLARVGTSICHAIGAACGGNPLGWGVADANVIAAAFIGVVGREATVWGGSFISKITSWLQSKTHSA